MRVARNPQTGKYWDGTGFVACEECAKEISENVKAADFAKIFTCPIIVFDLKLDSYSYIPGSNYSDWEYVDHANCKHGAGY